MQVLRSFGLEDEEDLKAQFLGHYLKDHPRTFKWLAGVISFLNGLNDTVDDGRNPAPVEVGSLSHYLQRFIHPTWYRISEPSTVKVALGR